MFDVVFIPIREFCVYVRRVCVLLLLFLLGFRYRSKLRNRDRQSTVTVPYLRSAYRRTVLGY